MACANASARLLETTVLPSPGPVLVTMTVLTLTRAVHDKRLRQFAVAGIYAGLAISLKYNAGALIIVALVAGVLIILEGRALRKTAVMGVLIFAVACGVSFVVGTPYALLDWRDFLHALGFQRYHFLTGHGIAIRQPFLHYLTFSLRYGLGAPMLIAALAGIPVFFAMDWRKAALLFSFPILYYAILGDSPTAFVRYAIPLVPFLCIAAAIAVRAVVTRFFAFATARVVTAIVAVAIALPSVLSVVAFDRLITKRDTRLLAADWLAAQRSPESTLYESGTFYAHIHYGWPNRVPLVGYDIDRSVFVHDDDSPAPPPDWIVVADSPLRLYTEQPVQLRQILDMNYELVQTFTGTSQRERAVWFDTQDAFFIPYVDFRYRIRPGPDLYIYRRRSAAK